ncbi:hypothetical protein MBLNU459_g6616t2 [Dothideomycetes sp. NU459]
MSASLDSLQLKHTNEQSLTASEDFYSVSSGSSGRSNRRASRQRSQSESRNPRRPAPASRYQTASESYEGIARPIEVRQVDTPRLTPMRGIGKRRQDEPGADFRRSSPIRRKPIPSTVFENPPNIRMDRPLSSHPPPRMSQSSAARAQSPPSPGADDDTAYIHFALDQLTRDEEVRGSRTYASPRSPRDDYDLGALPFDEDLPVVPRHGKDKITKGEKPLGEKFPVFPIPPRNPARQSYTNAPSNSPPQIPDVLVPFEAQPDSFHQPLDALPSILRPLRFGLFLLALTAFIILLLVAAIWSRLRTGLWDYGTMGDARYFVCQYLPTLIGMALLLWLFEIETAVYRVTPFVALASHSSKSRSHGALLPLQPSGFALPTFAPFKAGLPVIGFFLFVSWLSLLTIPLLASSFNVYFRGTPGHWVWLATQGVIWTAIALYLLLLIASITLFFSLHRKQTGLKWDARNLADLITLIERSNVVEQFADYGLHSDMGEFRSQIAGRQDRLGYWQSSVRPNEVYHTLGAPDQPFRPYSADDFRPLREKITPPHSRYSNVQFDPESGRPYSHASNKTHRTTDPVLSQDEVGHNYIPWFLRPVLVALWIIIAIVLLLAFLVVSYLPSTRVSAGFLPDLPVIQSRFGFSSANFLYSFIPALLGLLCLLLWQPIDIAFRRLQPYASLSKSGGALAETSLLLTYSADSPVAVILKAAVNRHFRVAILSLVTLIAATLPILAGGVFWSQFYVSQQRVRISTHMTAFYALTAFLVLYALAYTLAFPGRGRKLPNRGRSLADIIALVHQSRVLDDAAFRSPATKIALVTRLLSASPAGGRISYHEDSAAAKEGKASKSSLADSLRGLGRARQQAGNRAGALETARYGFGKYMGRDGNQYVGIDRMGRPGVADLIVRA